MNPLVTIVIPVYNVAPYLDECLRSVLNQTYPKESMEIIAINDGSTDNSLEILRSYRNKLPSMQIIDQENKGLGATRNVGMGLAQGKYIYFLDSDDWIDPNLVTDCVKIMEEDSLEVCHFQIYVFDELQKKDVKSTPVLSQSKNQNFGLQTGMNFLKKQMELGENCAPVWQYFYRFDFLRKHDFSFPEKILHEDEPFTIRVLLLAERFANLAEAYFIRRIRPGSIMTTTNRLDRAENYVSVLKEMHLFFDEMNQSQAALLTEYMTLILIILLKFYRLDEIWKKRSMLWSAAKMANSIFFRNVPDFLGGLYIYMFSLFHTTRRFAGKTLRRLGLR